MSSHQPRPRPPARARPRARRPRRKPPPPPTEWRHVVAALSLTLLALVSWGYTLRGPSDEPRGGEPIAGDDATASDNGPPRSFSLAAAGDVLIHEPVFRRAAANATPGAEYDFRPMFAGVAPIVRRADLGICHMETPVSRDNSDVTSYPIFNAPREVGDALAHAGFDLCSTASNHSMDKGPDGVRTTLKSLARSGLRTEGTAAGKRAARRPELFDLNGVSVGHLSYTYGLNGFVLPAGQEYLVNLIDVKGILRAAGRARRMGAEYVVVSLHWGQEFQTEPTEQQSKGARRLLRSDEVDLILGHHTHVPQPIKKVGREFAILGMGNLISNQRPGATTTCCLPQTQDGLVVGVNVRETGDEWETSVTYWPTWVHPESFEVLPVASALKDPDHRSLYGPLTESWRRTVTTVNLLGARRAGVRPAERPQP